MNSNQNMRIVTLKDLWDLLMQRFLIILLAAVAAVGVLYGVNAATQEPLYESTATLYISRQSDESTSSGDASNDFSLALKVINDCTYLLKSHTVLDQVIEELSLTMDYDELYSAISTHNPDSTRILEVTVEASSPQLAKRIVDKICELGKDSITEAMGFEQVNLFEYGVLNQTPCNNTSMLTYALVGMIAAVFVYTVFLLIYLLDDRIRTTEDIENYLGLSVLGEIPDGKEASKNKYGYYRGYGYGYGKKPKKGK